MDPNDVRTEGLRPPPKAGKPYRGVAMEGMIARSYAKSQRNNLEQYRIWAKLASGGLADGSRVLEVAPGPGYLSVELGKLGRYRIVGLDISETFVEIASQHAKDAGVAVEFRQGDAARMPFPDASFDFVICTSAFKNFPQPVRVLDEIFRVLSPSGRAVVIDLRREAAQPTLDAYVDRMRLGWVGSLMTKATFRRLRKAAYTREETERYVAASRFRTCAVVDEDIGREIWLRKTEATP